MDKDRFLSFKYWPHAIILTLVIVSVILYNYFTYYDTRSSDSYVSANVINVASLVNGTISQIYIKDNQSVKKGDQLLQIDPLPFQLSLQKAEAKWLELKSRMANENAIIAAKADYEQAKYLYDHTVIRAPTDGYVSNFNLSKGQFVKKGKGLFALIENNHWWIVTRYRETAIRLIKAGDKAEITVDMFPGVTFHGHVSSVGWGVNRIQSNNSSESTLMTMATTEEWVKIAQRFPVRIEFDDLTSQYPMRVGASATTRTYR